MQSKEQEKAKPSGVAASSSNVEADIDLAVVARFVSGSRRPICFCATLCGLICAIWVWLQVPVLYQSKVTMILPAYSRYSPQGFQKLLESDAIVNKTQDELRGRNILAADEKLEVDDNLKTTLQLAPVGNIVPSVLAAIASHPDRDKAVAIAATWASVFSQKVKEVAATNPASALEDAMLVVRKALSELESKQNRTESELAKQELQLQTQTQQQLGEHMQAAAESLTGYLRDTTRLLSEKDAEYSKALAEQRRDRPGFKWRKSQFETLQTLELRLREEQVKLKRETEQPGPRAKQVEADLKSLQDQATVLDAEIQADLAAREALEHKQEEALEALRAEREIGRKALEQQQLLGEARIKAQANDAIESLRRESKAQIAQVARDIAQQSDLLAQASRVLNQEKVATMQQGAAGIQIARPPAPAPKALPRYMAARVVAAMFIGALLGALISFVRRSAWRGGS